MTLLRAAIYARYSSREQDGTSTIESQLRECRAYARRHGLTVAEDAVFVDRAKAGTSAEQRDAFQAMVAAAQRTPKPFDAILVWKYSRFARNREDSALYKGLLRRKGIEVTSVSEPVDRHSATGLLSEGLIELIDQFYSARLAEEVRRGQTEATLEGFSTGGRAPYGYRRAEVPDPRGRLDRAGTAVRRVTLAVEPAEAAVVQRIYELYAGGAGYTRIAKRLNGEGVPGPWGGTWAGSAIREMIRNDVYRGARVYGRTKKVRTAKGTRSKCPRPEASRTVKEGAHPAIIAPPLWERVKSRREAVATVYRESGCRFGLTRGVQTPYLLTGILKCAVCGANFAIRVAHTRRGGGKYYYYGCAFRARRGAVVCSNSTLLPQAAVEQELLEILQQEVLTPDTLGRLLAAVNARLRAQTASSRPRIDELRRALATVEREIANYARAIGRGDFTSLEQALAASEQRRATLQAELASLDGSQQPAVIQLTPAALQRHLDGIIEKLRSGVNGKVREAIQRMVAQIVVGEDGSLTLDTKPVGLLRLNGTAASRGRQGQPQMLELTLVYVGGRQWRAILVA